MAFVEPLGVFLADFGAPVTFAGAPDGALGLMDFEDREILADEGRAAVVGRFRTLLVLTSVADLLTIGATLTDRKSVV